MRFLVPLATLCGSAGLIAVHAEQATKNYFGQPIVDAFDPACLLSNPLPWRVDFLTVKETDLHRIEIPFSFKASHTCNMHGLATWFDVDFIGKTTTVVLTTAPGAPTTHWYQLRCMFQAPVFVLQGQAISGTMLLQAHKKQSYFIHMTLQEPIAMQNTLDLNEPFHRASGYFCPAQTPHQATPSSTHQHQQATQQVQEVQQLQQRHQQLHEQQQHMLPPYTHLSQHMAVEQQGQLPAPLRQVRRPDNMASPQQLLHQHGPLESHQAPENAVWPQQQEWTVLPGMGMPDQTAATPRHERRQVNRRHICGASAVCVS